MATFITTIQFTEQGVKHIDQTTKRAAAFEALAKKMGATVTHLFWTIGNYDGLIIFEADDETATTLMMRLGAEGNVRTKTVRAFTAAAVEKMLAAKK